MKTPRTRLLEIHRWLSLAGLVWILIISVTGTVLVNAAQITAWSRPELFESTPGDRGPQAMVDAALTHFENDDVAIDNISLPGDNGGVYVLGVTVTPRASAEALATGRHEERVGRSWLVHVDPGTAKVNGARPESSGFIYWCRRGHYLLWQDNGFLWIDGDDLAGLVALALLGIALTGFYIWYLPRLKHRFRRLPVRFRRGFLTFNLDLHRALGLVVVAPLTVIAFTGASFSYPDMKLVWERLTPAQHDYVQNEPEEDLVSEEVEGATVITTNGVRDLLREKFPTYTIESLEPPTESDGVWGAWLTRGYSPHQRANSGGNVYVNIDRYSHEVVYLGSPEAGNVWDQAWEDWILPLHAGDFLGNTSRTAWLAIGLSPLVLSGTGVIVWWRRRRPGPHRNDRGSDRAGDGVLPVVDGPATVLQ